MTKYKYMEAEDSQGVAVKRGDFVMAFVPDNSGKRRVLEGEVVAINAKTIRVKYFWEGKAYTTNVPERYWASFNEHLDEIRCDNLSLNDQLEERDACIAGLELEINELEEKLNG